MDAELQVKSTESSIFSCNEAGTSKETSLLTPDDRVTATNKTPVTKDTQANRELFPDYLKILSKGKEVCGDSYAKFSKPDWLDMEKFQRGQRFAVNHIYGVMYGELLSLMILFAFRGGLEPLIFTGKSDTPFKAFKRYLSTVVRVKSWYEGDIWDVNSLAHKNLMNVRKMHDAIRKSLNAGSQTEIARKVTLDDVEGTRAMWTELIDEIREDLQSSCPFSGSPLPCPNEVYINQCDMAITQFGFLGLILAFPKKFGIHYASRDDLDGLAHFWRTIGYLLGTEDRFNLCDGDLETVQQRCRDIIQFWVKPAFRTVSRDWIHMTRCLIEGISFYVPGMSLQVPLMYLCGVLDIKAVKLASSMTYRQYFLYLETVFVFWFVLRLPGMWRLHNWLINFAVKKAQNMSAERLTKLEERVYPPEIRYAAS